MPANLTPEYKAAEAAFPRTKREDRCARVVRPLDRRRDELAAEVATRRRGLSGGDLAAAQRLLAMIAQATLSDGTVSRG